MPIDQPARAVLPGLNLQAAINCERLRLLIDETRRIGRRQFEGSLLDERPVGAGHSNETARDCRRRCPQAIFQGETRWEKGG